MNLSPLIERARGASVHRPEGTIVEVNGLIVEVGGLRAAVGDCLTVPSSQGLRLEVVGFRKSHLLTTPLGSTAGLRRGSKAVFASHGGNTLVGDGLLGRGRGDDGDFPQRPALHEFQWRQGAKFSSWISARCGSRWISVTLA